MSQEYVHFFLQPYALLLLAVTLHIIYFVHLLSTNHKCTQPCYFFPTTQTCCLEGEDGLEFFNKEF
jgi:hypothetical protein